MKNLTKIVFLAIIVLFSLVLPAQEAVIENSKIKKPYSKILHSVAFEYNNALYFKGKMTQHPYSDLGYETLPSYGTEWILKYNLTFKSGFGFSLEAVKGTCNYRFGNRSNGWKDKGETPFGYFVDNMIIFATNKLGCNIKTSYRYDINEWLTILPEIGLQMLYYNLHGRISEASFAWANPDGTWSQETYQIMKYDNETLERRFFPDLSASFNFLFHKKDDPRHNFTVGLNANLCFGVRYLGSYSATPPFETADCLFSLTSNYVGLRFGYSYSSFPKPVYKKKEERQKAPYTVFDLQNPVHSVGLLVSGGGALKHKFKNTKGVIQPYMYNDFVPELTLKYSCAIKNGWGVTAEIPFGFFRRGITHGLALWEGISDDTVWSNGVVGRGYPTYTGMGTYYLGFSLKASYLAQVHKNISLQSEVGVKWLPFVIPAKMWDIGESVGKFYISDGTETEELVYMNCLPVLSATSYAVPDFAFSFNVLVHGKNPANNFVFGINGNISFMDRFHFKYQTTNVLPEYLQSSGEFGWRMSSIGFHIGYQWMTGKKTKCPVKNNKT